MIRVPTLLIVSIDCNLKTRSLKAMTPNSQFIFCQKKSFEISILITDINDKK